MLPMTVLLQLAEVFVSNEVADEDMVSWGPATDGQFSCRYAYKASAGCETKPRVVGTLPGG